MLKKYIYQQDTELSDMPQNTVQDWIDWFLQIRQIARNIVNRAFHWGNLAPSRVGAYKKDKDPLKREKLDIDTLDGTTDSLKKDKQKKKAKRFEVKTIAFEEVHHCWLCGMSNHDEKDCFKDKDPKHEDRNQENKPFNESTKGKRWMAEP